MLLLQRCTCIYYMWHYSQNILEKYLFFKLCDKSIYILIYKRFMHEENLMLQKLIFFVTTKEKQVTFK